MAESKGRTTLPLASLSRNVFKWSFRLVKWGCVFHCFSEYVGWFSVCSGTSMEPTLSHGDIIVVNRYIRHFGRLKRNDVICFKDLHNPKKYLCKRLVGMGGDSIYDDSSGDFVTVPKGHIWVEGDNRMDALDSRSFGSLPYGLIDCKVVYKFGGGFPQKVI